MEFDLHLLLDILEFLQTLKNVPLPAMFETSREKLLGRVQVVLSPGDNYIDMKPGKLLPNSSFSNKLPVEENILSSNLSSSSFLYDYRSKLTDSSKKMHALKPPQLLPPVAAAPVVVSCEDVITVEKEEIQEEEKTEESLMKVYLTMSLEQAENKSYKFGELRRKEKRFIFETIRPCWAVVIGSHFLAYDGKADTKPSQVLPLKAGTCRPAFSIPRSIKKFSDLAFDICLEDCRVFQFIAQTPEEMEQWLEAIRQVQIKAYTKKVDQPSSNISPEVKQPKSLVKRKSSGEEYDTIIPDIVGALGLTPKASALPCGQQIPTTVQLPVPDSKILKEAPKIPPPIHTLPPKPSTVILPTRIIRKLPPPPVATHLDDEADTIYNEIENPQAKRQAMKPEHQIAIPYEESDAEEEEDEEEVDNDATYDDVANVKQQISLLERTNKRNAVIEMPVQRSVDEEPETYDDVEEVKIEVQLLREAEAAAAAKAAAHEKEKRILKTPPKVPTRVSPIKCFFDKIRQRNESPQKAIEQRKQVADVTAEQQREISTEMKSDQKPAESSSDYMKNKLLDNSNYNTPRTPKPVHVGKLPGEVIEDEKEEIYDDVLEGANFGKRVIGRDNEAEKHKKNDVLLTKYTSMSDGVKGRSVRGAKKAVKNFTNSFEGEVYENQPKDKSVQGYSEFHQTQQFTNSNLQPAVAVAAEHDDKEEALYDDVQIVMQKSRSIGKSKKKLTVESPPKNILTSSAAKNLFPVKKTTIEKIPPRDNGYEDNENIYDDCATK